MTRSFYRGRRNNLLSATRWRLDVVMLTDRLSTATGVLWHSVREGVRNVLTLPERYRAIKVAREARDIALLENGFLQCNERSSTRVNRSTSSAVIADGGIGSFTAG